MFLATHADDAAPAHIITQDPAKAQCQGHQSSNDQKGHGEGHGHATADAEEALLNRYRMFDSMGRMYAPDVVSFFDLSPHRTVVDLGGRHTCWKCHV